MTRVKVKDGAVEVHGTGASAVGALVGLGALGQKISTPEN